MVVISEISVCDALSTYPYLSHIYIPSYIDSTIYTSTTLKLLKTPTMISSMKYWLCVPSKQAN